VIAFWEWFEASSWLTVAYILIAVFAVIGILVLYGSCKINAAHDDYLERTEQIRRS